MELVRIGLRVSRMIGLVADSETALAEAAAHACVDDGVPALATSLAEAIEADRAAAAAAEMRQTVVARAHAVSHAFDRVARSVRLTVWMVERLDRGWARGRVADDQPAMVRRQIACGVAEAIGRQAEGERAKLLTGALRERLDALDMEAGIGNRSAEEIIGEICRDLGLDPVRMAVRPPLLEATSVANADLPDPYATDGHSGSAGPPQRRPDG